MDTSHFPPDIVVCGYKTADLLKKIEGFHAHVAPGLVLGAFMVDLAQRLMGPGAIADAVVETRKCLPDAIQIFTPCTIGNGWMTVLDWRKFAITLYDKETFQGPSGLAGCGEGQTLPEPLQLVHEFGAEKRFAFGSPVENYFRCGP